MSCINKNSTLIWLPIVEQPGILPIGISSPRTEVIMYNHRLAVSFLEVDDGSLNLLIATIRKACDKIGYPCFLRTDLASAKHDGPNAYRIDSPDQIPNRIFRTVEDSEMKFWLERCGPQAFLVREFLNLDAPFTAFHGLPIAREWRIFADENKVLCAHPYWPEAALDGHVREPSDWKYLLMNMHKPPAAIKDLYTAAISVAHAIGGAWSVDFAMDKKGHWWLIDCATAEDSWHWPGCPNKAIQVKRNYLEDEK